MGQDDMMMETKIEEKQPRAKECQAFRLELYSSLQPPEGVSPTDTLILAPTDLF